MSELKITTVEKIPQWATCYIAYNDDSALSDDDKKLVNDFEEKLENDGLRLICPVDGSESEFEPYPAFGLACGTVDWTAEVLPKMFKVRMRKIMECTANIKAHSKAEAKRIANDNITDCEWGWNTVSRRAVGCQEAMPAGDGR